MCVWGGGGVLSKDNAKMGRGVGAQIKNTLITGGR